MGTIVRTTALAFLMIFQINTLAEVNTTGSAVDNNGNIVVIGYCLGNVRIAGQEYTITQPSVYILKLDPNGEMIWVKFANSNGSVKANAVAVDSSGNIYITGEFSGTANFDTYSLTAPTTDAFIAKYNHAGEVSWVKHGASPGTARGNDIFIKSNLVFVCGFAETITFDSLSTPGGGFVIIYNSNGSIINLYTTRDYAYKFTVDKDSSLILYTGELISQSYWPSLSKYLFSGENLWIEYINAHHDQTLCTDTSDNIFSVSGFINNPLFFKKFDSSGNLINSVGFGPGGSGKDMILHSQNDLILCGLYTNTFSFGNTTIQSVGLKDFFIAMIDTSFNPIWTKHGGGSYDDELINISLTNDGNIICNGNFTGAVTVDTIQITGGISATDKWVGITKFDPDGNLIWLKKIVEQFTPPSTANWFPLEVGNKFQYFKIYNSYSSVGYGDYSIKLFQVTDSVRINNKKYFSVDGFYWFSTGTKIRYEQESQQIFVLYNNQEYLFMDFSKVPGEVFSQIQYNGSFRNTSILTTNLFILDDSVSTKGFYNIVRVGGGGWPPMPYADIATWCYFAPEVGWVFQDEESYISTFPTTDLFIIEYLINKDGQPIHKKHTESATLNFNPVLFIPYGDSLHQNFVVLHPFSKQNVPASHGYFSYMNAYLQSFYFNGSDTLWNPEFQIQQTTEKDFTLNYQFDTTKYNEDYHLYYRIAAVDKGIVADTFYSPPTGFYKLFWRDSTTSVNQLSPDVFDYSLSQNYPNPFNPSTKISFSLPGREFVTLKVFDILGKEITTLVNEELDAGKYEVDFDGSDLSSGIYIYQFKSGVYFSTKKMLLIK
ncbi:MAG: T9SS type A sorting domain-containing protein [Ignavibacteriales bacterium]|nr:MAG: T9SS type A sorting domain-containing protein [Ignavibacteriales bacterium]